MAKTLKKRINIVYLVSFVFLTSLLYLYKLDLVPVHLNQDELGYSLQAFSVGQLFRDINGTFLPFYFWHLGNFWATPILIYLNAVFLYFLPFTEAGIRVSSVFVGLFSILLTMLLIKKIFNNNRLVLISGLLMVITPVLFIHSRLLLDNLYTVPFVLLWLVFLKKFEDKGANLPLFLSGLFLGVGFHSYHAAKVIMPIYLVMTLTYLVLTGKGRFRHFIWLVIGFSLPIIAFIPWLSSHPDTLLNQVSYIGRLDASVEVSKGILGVFNFSRLGGFISNYFTYLSPKILFISGDRSLIHSTGKIGAFTFPIIVFLIFGMLETIRMKDKFSKLILIGFFTYPIAPAIVNDPERISRGLVVIPFVVLLSIYGLKYLITQKKKALSYLVYILLLASLIQFSFFLNDYFGDYRQRSSSWFNGGIEKRLEEAIELFDQEEAQWLYMDSDIYFVQTYFSFVEIKQNRIFGHKKIIFDSKLDLDNVPKNSVVVLNDRIYYEGE